ncbi:hypothetical protein MA16_Dca023255 [Dendrobium catenatum]|uniref:Uncharacterized protein n=1 Tax=Dendrobium catenatum TaxID=906689 RepID=A0A2I0WH47_9ASPA|nr:hypothetical protein MA16_Dca023255 [Dendrobium catenatum]
MAELAGAQSFRRRSRKQSHPRSTFYNPIKELLLEDEEERERHLSLLNAANKQASPKKTTAKLGCQLKFAAHLNA